MILLSERATNYLASGSARPWFRANLRNRAGGIVTTLAGDVLGMQDGGVSTFRRSVRPLSREYEISFGGVVAANTGNWLSWLDPTSTLSTDSFLGWTVDLDMMIPLDSVTTEEYRAFTGSLAALTIGSNGTAQMKVSDYHEVLRASGPGNKVNVAFPDDSPASLIWTILGSAYANIPSGFLDSASFSTAMVEERLDRRIVRGFSLTSGSWLDGIQSLLTYANAVVTVDRFGKIGYKRLRPESISVALVLTEGGNTESARLTVEKSPIRNKAHVERWDPVTSAMVSTGYSPITDTASVTAYGERWDRTWSYRYFTENQPAALAAGQNINLQAQPPDVLEIDGDLSLFALDLLDTVQVYSPRIGLTGDVFQVFEVALNPQRMSTTLTLMRTSLVATNWLQMGTGHLLNGSRRVF